LTKHYSAAHLTLSVAAVAAVVVLRCRHLPRLYDYLWVAEDGMRMQVGCFTIAFSKKRYKKHTQFFYG
jgi:hypothetical protein